MLDATQTRCVWATCVQPCRHSPAPASWLRPTAATRFASCTIHHTAWRESHVKRQKSSNAVLWSCTCMHLETSGKAAGHDVFKCASLKVRGAPDIVKIHLSARSVVRPAAPYMHHAPHCAPFMQAPADDQACALPRLCAPGGAGTPQSRCPQRGRALLRQAQATHVRIPPALQPTPRPAVGGLVPVVLMLLNLQLVAPRLHPPPAPLSKPMHQLLCAS